MKICKRKIMSENEILFQFANGKEFLIDVETFDIEIQKRFTLHGASQKLGDAFADADSVDDAVDKFIALRDQLIAGDWSGKRETGMTLLLSALIRATGKTEAECKAVHDALSTDDKKAALKIPAVAAAVAAITAERAAKKAAELAGKITEDEGNLENLFS